MSAAHDELQERLCRRVHSLLSAGGNPNPVVTLRLHVRATGDEAPWPPTSTEITVESEGNHLGSIIADSPAAALALLVPKGG